MADSGACCGTQTCENGGIYNASACGYVRQGHLASSMRQEQEAQGLLGSAEGAVVEAQEQLEALQPGMQQAHAECR